MSMLDPAMTKLLEQLLSSPDIPAQLKDTVTAAMSDPAKLDDALAQLQALGADQVGSGPPLSIADYYVDGVGLYQLIARRNSSCCFRSGRAGSWKA